MLGRVLLTAAVAVMALMMHSRAYPSCGSDTTTRVVALINTARFKAGVPAVSCDARLLSAAEFHTTWMADHNCLSHACPDEQGMWDRIQTRGYPVLFKIGEIAALGQQTPEEVVAAWLNSSGHHDIMLSADYPDIGCAEKATY